MLALETLACSKSPRFTLLKPEDTGIEFSNTITESDSFHVMSYEYIYNGAGVGIGDLNNDGLQDIIFAGNQVSSKVYLNMGDFKFRDITDQFKGLSNDQWYSGVTIVDINNDRWPDLYLSSTAKDPSKSKNRLWINNGAVGGQDPTFTEMAEKYGIADSGQSVNSAFFDYDLDGDLDLYVLTNTVSERMSSTYRPKINDGSAENNDRLYRNNGDGTFTNVTIEAGIVFEGFGLGIAVGDVNKDGFPDIYISNDYMSNDLLYINQGNGTFRNEISKYISYQTKSSMGDDMADINNDGFPDIYTMDMLPEEYYKKKQTINGFSYKFYDNDAKYGYEHQFLRNMLHMHNGLMNGEMLPYSEAGQMMGIYQTEWSWSPLFADYDNDGDKDLLVANGYPKDLTDKDWTKYRFEVYGSIASAKHVISKAPAIKVPNKAFENSGEMHFEQKTKEWLGLTPSFSYGAAFVDLDNDGDLDYVTNNIDDRAFVYKNTTIEKSKKKANFLRVKLSGKEPNTMAIGAKVEIWTRGQYQFIENFLTRGYASSVDPVIHFGFADDSSVDSLKITWPLGKTFSLLKNIKVNQTVDVNETSAISVDTNVHLIKAPLLFEDVDNVIDYTHEQNDFPDFFLGQKIMPHKFSQIGPCIAKGDIDNDGQEDIIIGSTNKMPMMVFLRKGNQFVNTQIRGLTTYKSVIESDLAIVDMDNDGDNDVISLAGGYENREEGEYRHYMHENRNGVFVDTLLPVPQFPASVVRPFDFDHDGDMDLFVGSRVKYGMFPYANHSWIVLNDKGHLYTVPEMKLNLGMVTDAIWSDYDKDGWEDLIVTREWNSIAILKNINGKELSPQLIPSIDENKGFWYSIASGDFDRDGDDDYILGNLGENHRFNVSKDYPMGLYVMDIDRDGILDPISTAYWKDKDGVMQEYPINYLDELWGQSIYFQRKYRDYASFSYDNIKEILGTEILKHVDFKLLVNTTSSYILWNNKGSFRWEKLPRQLQVSPIKKMIIQDLNNDQYPDVIISGNDHTFDIATGYYDANKGNVLMNTGKGSFNILSPSQSGLLLNGMVESLLYLKGDTSLVVAGINRNKLKVYRQK
jgi:hypothetical protein